MNTMPSLGLTCNYHLISNDESRNHDLEKKNEMRGAASFKKFAQQLKTVAS